MRRLTEIIVHCSATRPEWMAEKSLRSKIAEIRRWHVEDRKWRDIGYHYIVDRDGIVDLGRPMASTGAHVEGHNTGTVGVCLIGGHGSSPTDKFGDHFTPEQDMALRGLISSLKEQYPEIRLVTGHNDYAAKACPGFKVKDWLTGKPKTMASSTTIQASAMQLASGTGAGIAAIGALDGTAQLVALGFAGVIILAALWIMRERIEKWASGVH